MFKISENTRTVNLGDSNLQRSRILALAVVILIAFPIGLAAQYYYVNVYDNPTEDNLADIYIKSVDLNTHSIHESVRLANRGNIWFKKPAIISLRNRDFLITMSEYGAVGRNTMSGNRYKAFYSVLRADAGHLSLLRSDSVSGAIINIFRQYQGEQGFRFGLRSDRDSTALLPFGLYNIDDGLNFRLRNRLDSFDEPGLIRYIDSHEFLIRVPNDSINRLYYTIFNDSQWWLVKLNSGLSSIIDSIQLRPQRGANTVFAYHPARNKFYCLQVNYELHGASIDSVYKRREEFHIEPKVIVIDPETLAILEQHPISDYPEGNYPGYDDGLADVVGDFIVYYFFQEENTEYFSPAMLLIFDTRNNEATWLRVGWR